MTKFQKFYNLAIAFAFILSAPLAQADLPDAPKEFYRYYDLNNKGEIRNINAKIPASLNESKSDATITRVFSTADDTTAWHVGSIPCSQNKEFSCVSVYTKKDSRSTGNQQSFLNKNRQDTSTFTLYQLNPKKPEQNTVVSCNSKFTTGGVRDRADLTGCVKYSKDSCDAWAKTVAAKKSLFTELAEKGAECSKLLQDADQLKIDMKNIFQGDIKDSEKEISKNFDEATRGNAGLRLTTKVALQPDKDLNSQISTYQDIFKRSEGCDTYSEVFTDTYKKKQANLESLSNEPKAAQRKKGSKTSGQQ